MLDTEPLRAAAERLCATDTPEGDRQAEVLAELGELLGLSDTRRPRAPGWRRDHRIVTPVRQGEVARQQDQLEGARRADALDALREEEAVLAAQGDELIKPVQAYRQRLLGAIVGSFVLDSAAARASEGTLEFHDLLVSARRLLATRSDVRAVLHERYSRVLLDEFQDTDPIQLEIAVRLTARPEDPAHDTDWRQLRPLPGRLFIVGDPKQSIYRFRRADIAQYLRAAEQTGAETELLTANFRSSAAVIDWVNHVFSELIVEQADVQPAYHALEVCRPRLPRPRHRPRARRRGPRRPRPRRGDAEGAAVRCEAAAAADAVVTALVDGWPVEDEDTTGSSVGAGRATSRCCSRPARRCLHSSRRSASATISYRAENSSVVYTTAEIRHLMLALRAADDPTDSSPSSPPCAARCTAAATSSCSNGSTAGGRWNVWSAPPEALADASGGRCDRPRALRRRTDLVADTGRPAGGGRRRAPGPRRSRSTAPTHATSGVASAT